MEINLGPALEQMAAATAAYDEALNKAVEPLRDELINAFRELPDEILKIAWTQYTPYFNDGEPCVFGVNPAYVLTRQLTELNPGVEDECHWEWLEVYGDWDEDETYADERNEDGSWNKIAVPEEKWRISKEAWEPVKQLSDFIQSQGDLFERAFGDHAEIVLTREDLIVEEYDHD